MRNALGAPLRPLVVTNIYNDPVLLDFFWQVISGPPVLILFNERMILCHEAQASGVIHPSE
jgi:hypothetical protein